MNHRRAPSLGVLNLAPTPAPRGWSDILHPCLLLEMRRSVRSGHFLFCFLGLHAIAISGLFLNLFVSDKTKLDLFDSKYTDADTIFWLCVAPLFLLALPATGLFALTRDVRLRTIEIVLMTRIGPLGIMYGKWIAKVFEALLMACTLMPYAVIRY